MAEAPLLEAWDWRFLAGYLTGGFAVFALAMLFGRTLFGHGLAILRLQGLAAAWPNVGYMGLPLVITAFGEKATLPAVLIIVFDALVTLSIAIALIEAGLGRGGRFRDSLSILPWGPSETCWGRRHCRAHCSPWELRSWGAR